MYQDDHLHTQYSHIHSHTCHERDSMCRHKSLVYNKSSMEDSYYQVNNGTE